MSEKKNYKEIPNDTNGEWVETEGWYDANLGDYIPGNGTNQDGFKKAYFKGKAIQSHTEVEAKGIGKLFYVLSILLFFGFMICIFLTIFDIFDFTLGFIISILLFGLGFLSAILGMKTSK